MAKTFKLKAGLKAIDHIKKRGLSPDDITVMNAAAGGPRWISLYAFDKYLAQQWFQDRTKPLHLVGSSSGAWRMMCHALPDTLEAFDRFLDYYVNQSYDTLPPPELVANGLDEVVSNILGDNTAQSLLDNTNKKLYIISTLCHTGRLSKRQQQLYFGKLGFKNLFSRNWLAKDVERIIFTNTTDSDVILEDRFTSKYLAFNDEHLIHMIRSTGTLPFLMTPVDSIPELNGVLWDGAIIDYQIGLEYNTDGLIFFPHYMDTLHQGYFDQYLPYRKFNGKVLDRMIMLSPSEEYIKSLPNNKISDSTDWKAYLGNNEERTSNWYEVARRGQEIVDEFDYYYRAGKLMDVIEPIK